MPLLKQLKPGDEVWVVDGYPKATNYDGNRLAFYKAEFGNLVLVQWYTETGTYVWVKKDKVNANQT